MSRFVLTAEIKMRGPTTSEMTAIASQMKAGLAGINVPINLNIPASQQRVLKTVSNNLNTVRQQAKQTTDSFELLGKSLSQNIRRYGSFTVATGAFIRLGIAIRRSIGEAIDFETEIRKIAQGQDATISSFAGLKKEIDTLSKSLGVSSLGLANTSRILAQAGLSAGEVKVALEALAKSELAPTFGDVNETTEASIAIFRQFGIQANELKGILGSVNKVSADFAVESEDIAAAVRLAGASFSAASPQFQKGEESFRQFISLFTSVRQTTRGSAESIATGLRTIITRLQRSGTIEYFRSLGIELRDNEGQFVGAYNAIRKVSEALDGIPGTDPRFANIAELLGGYRQIDKTIPLLQQFAVAEKAYQSALQGRDSLDKGLALAQETLAQKFALVREEFNSLVRKISENEGFRQMISLALKLSSAMIKVVESVTPLLPLITALGLVKLGIALPKIGKGFVDDYRKVTGRKDGGKVHYFNKGGIVPGSGNQDTVAAMLTPGERVIPKKFAQGGTVPGFGVTSYIRAITNNNKGSRKTLFNFLNAKLGKKRPGDKYQSQSSFDESELFATKDLFKFQDIDRTNSPKYKELLSDISKHGIKEPGILNYNPDLETASFGEGNHRLTAAKELGINIFPVRGLRSSREKTYASNLRLADNPRFKVSGFSKEERESRHGYVPGDLAPSEFGVLPVQFKKDIMEKIRKQPRINEYLQHYFPKLKYANGGLFSRLSNLFNFGRNVDKNSQSYINNLNSKASNISPIANYSPENPTVGNAGEYDNFDKSIKISRLTKIFQPHKVNEILKHEYVHHLDNTAKAPVGLSGYQDLLAKKTRLTQFANRFIANKNTKNPILNRLKKGMDGYLNTDEESQAFALQNFEPEQIIGYFEGKGPSNKALRRSLRNSIADFTFGKKRPNLYANGGLVPGIGNTDSVPMDLENGQYVIRKKAVQAIGASNLAKMASGGDVRTANSLVMPGEYIFDAKSASRIGYSTLDKLNYADGGLQRFASGGGVGKSDKYSNINMSLFDTEQLEKTMEKLFDEVVAKSGKFAEQASLELEDVRVELSRRKAEIDKSVVATSKIVTPEQKAQQANQRRVDELSNNRRPKYKDISFDFGNNSKKSDDPHGLRTLFNVNKNQSTATAVSSVQVQQNTSEKVKESGIQFALLTSILGQTIAQFAGQVNPTLGKLVSELTGWFSVIQAGKVAMGELSNIGKTKFFKDITVGDFRNPISGKSFNPLNPKGLNTNAARNKSAAGTLNPNFGKDEAFQQLRAERLSSVRFGRSRVGRFASGLGSAKNTLIQRGLGAGGGLAAGIGIGGAVIESVANDNIIERESKGKRASGFAIGSSIGGSALKGAGDGAAIGSIFGPFGTAIGAAVGGLAGFTDSLTNLSRLIDEAGSAKYNEKAQSQLAQGKAGSITLGALSSLAEKNNGGLFRSKEDKFAIGGPSTGDRIKRLISYGFLGQNNEQRTKESLESKGFTRESFQGLTQAIAGGDKNAYNKVFKSKEGQSIRDLAKVVGVGSSEFEAAKVAFEKMAKTIGKAKEILDRSAISIAKYQVFLDKLNIKFDTIEAKSGLASSRSDEARSGNIAARDFGAFENLAKNGISTSEIDNILKSNPNQNVSNNARLEIAASEISQRLLAEKAEKGVLDEGSLNQSQLGASLTVELNKLFKNASPEFKQMIENQGAEFENTIQKKFGGSEENQIRGSEIKSFAEDLKNVPKPSIEASFRFAKIINQTAANMSNLSKEMLTINLDGISKLAANIEQFDNTLSNVADLRGETFNRINSTTSNRNITLGAIGTATNSPIGPSGNSLLDVARLGQLKAQAEQGLIGLANKRDSGITPTAADIANVDKFQSQLEGATRGLKLFGEGSESVIAALESKASELRQKREAAGSAALGYLTGDADSRRQQRKDLSFATKLASGKATIRDFQGNAGGVQTAKQLFGDKEANQLLAKVPGLEKLFKPNVEEDKLHQQIILENQARKNANDLLVQQLPLMTALNKELALATQHFQQLNTPEGQQKVQQNQGPGKEVITHNGTFNHNIHLNITGINENLVTREQVQQMLQNGINSWWAAQHGQQGKVNFGVEHVPQGKVK